MDELPTGTAVLRRVASFDTFSIDSDEDDEDRYNVDMEDCWLGNNDCDITTHEQGTHDLEMQERKLACPPKGRKARKPVLGKPVLDSARSMVVEDKEDMDNFLDEIMVDLIGGSSFIPGIDEEERDSLQDIGDSLHGRTATSFQPRPCEGRPVTYGDFRLSTPPASPTLRHCDDLAEEPPMVTPDETPLGLAIVGEQLEVYGSDSYTADLALLNPSTRKKYNNKRSIDAAMMEDDEGSGDEDSLSPPALFAERPFPLSMKPTLRILLYLDENWQDRVKVRTAFDVVSHFYKKHKDGDKRYRKVGQLGGAIFEALIDALGEDLGETIRLSHSYESSRLEDLFRAPGGSSSHSPILQSPRKRATPKKASIASPTMIELAIAYGANFKRLHPNVLPNSLAEQVRMGALAVESMDEAQQQKAWAKLMKTSLP
jgi:hypothetical protein